MNVPSRVKDGAIFQKLLVPDNPFLTSAAKQKVFGFVCDLFSPLNAVFDVPQNTEPDKQQVVQSESKPLESKTSEPEAEPQVSEPVSAPNNEDVPKIYASEKPSTDASESVNDHIYDVNQTRGPSGPQGLRGAVGPQGDKGPAGPSGERGPAGLQGDKGPSGERGPAGLQGDKGSTGDKGPQGDKGPLVIKSSR